MTLKRDSWLVRGVLILAVAAFVAVPVLFAFNGRSSSQQANPSQTQTAADQATKLQGQIDGYTAVLEREPENETALIGLIEAKIALGDLEGTVEPLERLANLRPETPEYAIALAQTKQQLGDLEGAAQVYRRVLTQTPGSVPALEGLVALLISQERSEAAIGLLQDTLTTADQTNELTPGSIDKLSVKLLLGQVYVEQQNYDQALKIYDEAIADAQSATPTQPDFRPTLAKALVLQEQGKTTEATALFDQALALTPTQYKDGVQQLIDEKTGATPTAPSPSGDAAGESPDEAEAPAAE
ncbi:tetratricopeptide repeat protein [Leptolyngbya sp. BC1307]|uniref:tetratricopeptide repeat protein n=1 Tax=Leptolyngbya sp. BC1307 TaxID=2029589 RepID=UPI000EFA7BAC|nr:tetratricopeptide repeat protein [Leptolyngbya sp. BC1307]